jgi:hypothetical protein
MQGFHVQVARFRGPTDPSRQAVRAGRTPTGYLAYKS